MSSARWTVDGDDLRWNGTEWIIAEHFPDDAFAALVVDVRIARAVTDPSDDVIAKVAHAIGRERAKWIGKASAHDLARAALAALGEQP